MTRPKRVTKQGQHSSDRAISLAALIISLFSAAFSYQQMRLSEQQILLNSQQLRPHVTIDPTFFPEGDEMRIDVYSRNNSPLPARVLFTDVSAAIDGQMFGQHFFSLSPDILHQGKNGVSTLPPIQTKYSSKVIKGESSLIVATCTVYASTSDADKRRWMFSMLSEYVPGLHVGSHKLIEELEVSTDIGKCEATNILRKVAKEAVKQ